MPSLEHEAPLEVIRQEPGVVADLVRAFLPQLPLPDKVKGTLAAADLSQIAPPQYLADTVVVLANEKTRKPVLAVVVEPQGRDRETKKLSWPVYVTAARKTSKVDRAILVVICWNSREAVKCRQVIATGHPDFDLYPIVIDPRTFPGRKNASPYLTILAGTTGAIDLKTPDGRTAVLDAIKKAKANDGDTAALSTIIMGVATQAARRELEALMTSPKYRSTFVDGLIDKGAVQAKAEDLIMVIRERGLDLKDAQRKLVTSCSDLSQLGAWLSRAVTAKSTDDIFGAHAS